MNDGFVLDVFGSGVVRKLGLVTGIAAMWALSIASRLGCGRLTASVFWHSSSGQRRINDLVPCGSYRIRGHGLPLWTDAPYMNLSPRAFGYRRYVGAVYRLTPLLLVAGMLVFHVFVNWLLHRGPCMGH